MSLNLSSYKGTRDLYPVDMMQRNYIFDGWRNVVEQYGYQEYMAPLLEPIDIYAAKSGEEIVNEQTYSFQDRGGRQMVIRPEMTPSITRMVAARRQEMPMPARLYSIANFMRYERPQHGREREFVQLNFDLFGIDNIYAELEIINMSHDVLTCFGATQDMFTIKVNDRQLTNFIMRDYLGLDEERTNRMIKLLDRFDKLPREAFDEAALEILGDDDKMAKLNAVISSVTIDDLPKEIRGSDVVKSLVELLDKLHQRGLMNVVYDVRLMRGFDYYTGIVFEAFDESPLNRRAMFGGGRYDGLVEMFGVESLPVVGVAPGETMVREFLLAHDLMPDFTSVCGPDVTILPLGSDKTNTAASDLATEIREAGLAVAVDYTNRKLDKKTKVAVKNSSRMAVYLGDDEIKSGEVTVKNLATGEQKKVSRQNLVDYLLDKSLESIVSDDVDGEE